MAFKYMAAADCIPLWNQLIALSLASATWLIKFRLT
jgi:hypothetical protein